MQDDGTFLIALTRWRSSWNRRRLVVESPWMGEVGGVRRRFVFVRGETMSRVGPSE